MAVARQPEPDQGIVMRPDRAVVVRGRIEALLARADGAQPPAREELRTEEAFGDARCAFRARDAGEKKLPGVGRAHGAPSLGAIEGKRVSPELFAPECRFEALLQDLGFGVEI